MSNTHKILKLYFSRIALRWIGRQPDPELFIKWELMPIDFRIGWRSSLNNDQLDLFQ